MKPNDFAIVSKPYATCATNASTYFSFCKVDDVTHKSSPTGISYDYATVMVNVAAHATNGTAILVCKFSESDTVTSPSSMTDIVALTGGTATSSTVGFVIPGAATTGVGGNMVFNIDLRGRKKYIGLSLQPGTTTTMGWSVNALLYGSESADTSTEKSLIEFGGTSVNGCNLIVAA